MMQAGGNRGPELTPSTADDEALDPLHGVMRHGAWLMAAVFVPGVYAVLLIAYLLRTLGPESYGIWAAATALVGYLTLLDAGLSATTARAAARAMAGDLDAIRQVRTAYGAYALLGIAAVVVGVALAALIPPLLRLEGALARDAWAVGAFLALDLGIVIATAGWMGTLRGAHRFAQMLLVNVAQVALTVPVLLILLPEHGLVGAAAAQPVGRIGARLLAALILTRLVPWFRAVPGRPTWLDLRTVWAFSLPILAMQSAAQIGSGTDVIIVGAASGIGAAGLFAVGALLPRYVSFFLFPALGVLLPSFSATFFRRPEVVPDLIRRAVLLAGLIGGAVYGGIALQAAPLLQTWTGQASDLSVQVLTIYAVVWMVVTPTHVMMLMVIAGGRHRLIGAIVLAEAFVNLALSILLVMLMGPVGAAVSSLVVILIDDILILPFIAARALHDRALPILGHSLAGVATGGAIALTVSLLPVAGVEGLVVRGILGAALLAATIAIVVPGSRALIAGRR